MKHFYITILFLLLVTPLLFNAQQVSNIHFEQVGKQIHIYYDLLGEGTYNVEVFCSTDDSQTWGNPLQKVNGAVGENQKPGNDKEIVWDVLAEREKLTGEINFKIEVASEMGYFTDIRDGQTYKWVKIGNQVWMAENLNYKTGNSWCYDNATANCNKYGKLYDWKTARGACPLGWHLPSYAEWDILVYYLGDSDVAGGKMKETVTEHWHSPNTGATNESGFSALPSGYRSTSGYFLDLGSHGYWWSATAYGTARAWTRTLTCNSSRVFLNSTNKGRGFSVRCVRD